MRECGKAHNDHAYQYIKVWKISIHEVRPTIIKVTDFQLYILFIYILILELAFKRPSIEKATEWNQHINEALEIQPSSDESSEDGARAAYFGMASAVVLGGIYAYRKWQKN